METTAGLYGFGSDIARRNVTILYLDDSLIIHALVLVWLPKEKLALLWDQGRKGLLCKQRGVWSPPLATSQEEKNNKDLNCCNSQPILVMKSWGWCMNFSEKAPKLNTFKYGFPKKLAFYPFFPRSNLTLFLEASY